MCWVWILAFDGMISAGCGKDACLRRCEEDWFEQGRIHEQSLGVERKVSSCLLIPYVCFYYLAYSCFPTCYNFPRVSLTFWSVCDTYSVRAGFVSLCSCFYFTLQIRGHFVLHVNLLKPEFVSSVFSPSTCTVIPGFLEFLVIHHEYNTFL